MATKKTNGKAPAKEQKRSSPSITARIDRLVDYKNSKINLSAYGHGRDHRVQHLL